MLKSVLSAGVAASLAFAAFPASANTWSENVGYCAEAFDEQGLASTDDYRAKFVRGSGGGVKKLTIKFIPVDDGDSLTGVCKIKRGEVISAEIKA